MPFANFTAGQSGLPQIGASGGHGVGMAPFAQPFAQQTPARNTAPMYSNILKVYVNWNICFSCGFDVEDGHTSKTCPALWRRANHQVGFDRTNASQNILKVMHKSQLPR